MQGRISSGRTGWMACLVLNESGVIGAATDEFQLRLRNGEGVIAMKVAWAGLMVVLLLAGSASAQWTEKWEAEFSSQYTLDQFSGTCPDGYGGVMAVGKQHNPNTDKFEAIYARFNEQGELLWVNVYASGQANRIFEDIAPTYIYQDRFVAVGASTENNDTSFLMVMIELDGTYVVGRTLEYGGGGYLNQIERVASSLVACGTTELDNGLQQGFVISLNEPYDVNWWQTYGSYDRNFLDDVKATSGGYAATGWGWTGNERAPWLLKIDYDGTFLWEQYYPQYDGAYPESLVSTGNFDLMMTGYSLISGNAQFFVLSTDDMGNELWMEEYGESDSQENGKFIGQASQGGYWVVGDGYGPMMDGVDIWAIRINNNGDLLESQLFNKPGDQNMWEGQSHGSTDIVIAGRGELSGSTELNPWVMRLTPSQDIEVFLDPLDPPVYVPFFGGMIPYTVTGVNNTTSPMQVDAWMQVEHVASQLTVEVRVFENVGLPGSASVSAALNQAIPQEAPEGEYWLRVFVGDYPWVQQTSDWFSFWKLGPTLATAAVNGDVFEQPELWPSTGSFGANAEAVVSASDSNLPGEYALNAAYPNPFNPTTTVSVSLPDASDLTVAVYNTIGQQVAELAQGRVAAGTHAYTFDASALSSGVYFVRASVPGQLNAMQKVVLMK